MTHLMPLHLQNDNGPDARTKRAEHVYAMLSFAKGMNGFRTPGRSPVPTLVESRAIAAGLMPAPAHEPTERSKRRAAAQVSRREQREKHPNEKQHWSNWQRHHGGAVYPFQSPMPTGAVA
jgi:hypothetical protein